MPELRTDWLSGRSIILAENRAQRPNEFAAKAAVVSGAQAVIDLALAEAGLPEVPGVPTCPFCVGNEDKTPRSLYEQLDADGRWQLRVVSNMFPAVCCELGDSSPANARGAHEVIVESARHIDRSSALSVLELHRVLEAYAHRLRFWQADGRFDYGLVFKNQGPGAGASISHLHSQFIALPKVPPAVESELSRAQHDYLQNGLCPYCRLIECERSFGERIVSDGDGFVAFCPYASLQPHEIWLLPARHDCSFERMPSDACERLAGFLHAILQRLEQAVPDANYNLMLRTAPWRYSCDNWCHWRIELLPRVNSIAGFEIATGVHINPLAPEEAARQLRAT